MKLISEFDKNDEAVDRVGVANLSNVMRTKLALKRAAGRGGWHDPARCKMSRLKKMLRDHVKKGDMVDVANLAMMIYNREHCMRPWGDK